MTAGEGTMEAIKKEKDGAEGQVRSVGPEAGEAYGARGTASGAISSPASGEAEKSRGVQGVRTAKDVGETGESSDSSDVDGGEAGLEAGRLNTGIASISAAPITASSAGDGEPAKAVGEEDERKAATIAAKQNAAATDVADAAGYAVNDGIMPETVDPHLIPEKRSDESQESLASASSAASKISWASSTAATKGSRSSAAAFGSSKASNPSSRPVTDDEAQGSTLEKETVATTLPVWSAASDGGDGVVVYGHGSGTPTRFDSQDSTGAKEMVAHHAASETVTADITSGAAGAAEAAGMGLPCSAAATPRMPGQIDNPAGIGAGTSSGVCAVKTASATTTGRSTSNPVESQVAASVSSDPSPEAIQASDGLAGPIGTSLASSKAECVQPKHQHSHKIEQKTSDYPPSATLDATSDCSGRALVNNGQKLDHRQLGSPQIVPCQLEAAHEVAEKESSHQTPTHKNPSHHNPETDCEDSCRDKTTSHGETSHATQPSTAKSQAQPRNSFGPPPPHEIGRHTIASGEGIEECTAAAEEVKPQATAEKPAKDGADDDVELTDNAESRHEGGSGHDNAEVADDNEIKIDEDIAAVDASEIEVGCQECAEENHAIELSRCESKVGNEMEVEDDNSGSSDGSAPLLAKAVTRSPRGADKMRVRPPMFAYTQARLPPSSHAEAGGSTSSADTSVAAEVTAQSSAAAVAATATSATTVTTASPIAQISLVIPAASATPTESAAAPAAANASATAATATAAARASQPPRGLASLPSRPAPPPNAPTGPRRTPLPSQNDSYATSLRRAPSNSLPSRPGHFSTQPALTPQSTNPSERKGIDRSSLTSLIFSTTSAPQSDLLHLPLPSRRQTRRATGAGVLIPVERIPLIPLPPLPPIKDKKLEEVVFSHQSLFPRDAGVFEYPVTIKHGEDGGVMEWEGGVPHYEKLEHVGDAILGGVVTTWLHRCWPGLTCGTATKLKAHLVSNNTLSHLSGMYHLPARLRCAPLLRMQTDIRAALVEAYIAGVYFSHPPGEGIKIVTAWLEEMYEPLADFFLQHMRGEHGVLRATVGTSEGRVVTHYSAPAGPVASSGPTTSATANAGAGDNGQGNGCGADNGTGNNGRNNNGVVHDNGNEDAIKDTAGALVETSRDVHMTASGPSTLKLSQTTGRGILSQPDALEAADERLKPALTALSKYCKDTRTTLEFREKRFRLSSGTLWKIAVVVGGVERGEGTRVTKYRARWAAAAVACGELGLKWEA